MNGDVRVGNAPATTSDRASRATVRRTIERRYTHPG